MDIEYFCSNVSVWTPTLQKAAIFVFFHDSTNVISYYRSQDIVSGIRVKGFPKFRFQPGWSIYLDGAMLL